MAMPRSDSSRSSLAKGLDLLGAIAERGADGMSLSAAARRAGLHTATAHRLLNVLVEQDYLGFDPYTKRYHLSLMPYEIVARAGQDLGFLDLRRRIRRGVETRREGLGGTVFLVVPSRGRALCIDQIGGTADDGPSTLRVGARRPLGVGAAGLVLLSTLSETEREAVIARETQAYARYGRLTADAVRQGCADTLARGYAVNEALIIPGVAAVGVGIHHEGALIGAVSVADAEAALASPRRDTVADALRGAVLAAGYSPDPGTLLPLRAVTGGR